MDWKDLTSTTRLNRPRFEEDPGRDAFQRDADRIVYSSAFRRLAHKTQVHPLSGNDHVHTRLTHSVEVASVGRSLGTMVGQALHAGRPDLELRSAIGNIVLAACLAHDIGNPPFGHSGEEAIRSWFKLHGQELPLRSEELQDFGNFDGNAQGFRVLTQLEDHRNEGGLQLTHATLAAYSKYTRRSNVRVSPGDTYPGSRKIGFFLSEQLYFEEAAKGVGLIFRPGKEYRCRHPLSFLVEAADDICYTVVDIEDGYELEYLSRAETVAALEPLAGKTYHDLGGSAEIAKLRGSAIRNLVREAARIFVDNERPLLDGTFGEELLKCTSYAQQLDNALTLARTKLYRSSKKTKLELAGEKILHALLDEFSVMALELESKGFDVSALTGRSERLARLLGRPLQSCRNTYEAVRVITDFISASTDRYALELHRALNGISF